MRARLFGSFALTLLLLLLFAGAAAAITVIQTSATVAANQVTFQIAHYEYGGANAPPEWVGFDVYRRALDDCGTWVRVTDQPYPRLAPDYQHTLVDTPPPNHSYEYRARFVDANREEVSSIGICDCQRQAYVSVPENQVAIAHGKLNTIFGASVEPCLGSCFPPASIVDPDPELLAYVGTNTTIRFYGAVHCNSFEGCAILVDHWEVANCEVVPTRRTSWGQVKTIYK